MTQVVAPQVPTTGQAPEGHDQAMIAKVDQTEASLQQQQQQQEPSRLAGKFTSPEELERAYLELERKLGQQPAQDKPQAQANGMTEAKAAELVQNAGLDIDAMTNYYNQNGELTADHYAALEKAGIPKAFVDQYIDGVQASANQIREGILGKVGGAEAFQGMSQWAQANMTPAELDAYNRAVDSTDMTVVENAVLGLAYRYQQAMGRDPRLLGGGAASPSGFQSVAQLVEAMKDPRYEKDHAYRKEVQDRLARSNIM